MRILFCNYEYPPLGGGGGVMNAALAEELASRHSVTVLSSLGPGLEQESVVNGVRVLRVPVYVRKEMAAANAPSMAAYMINGVRYGRKLLDREPFDVINTHFALPTGPVGDELAVRYGIPNVLSLHGGDLYDPSKFTSPHRHWILRVWVRSLLRRADAVVGQSANTVANAMNFFAPDVRPELIPLGITRPEFPNASRAELGFAEDDRILVTIGRLVARKGVDRLIRVLGRMKDPRAKLVVIGSGPRQEEWTELARAEGLADRVRFTGFVDESAKLALLAIADVYASTSQHEGFGLVFLEAMAAGLPVVCYDHGGQTDFLEDGKTGRLLHLNEEDAAVAALDELVADASLRERIGTTNLAKVEDYFIDTCARRYEELFEQQLRRTGGKRGGKVAEPERSTVREAAEQQTAGAPGASVAERAS
ncbi:glycosyltransferase family 4 protein [bacterium]|nr:glycosyltransferase family 4 protein [bacterium]